MRSKMPLILRKAVLEDATAILDMYFSAFSTSPVSLLCFPRDNNDVYVWRLAQLRAHLVSDTGVCLVVYDSSLPSTESIVGYARWVCGVAEGRQDADLLPAWSNTRLADLLFGGVADMRLAYMRARKHWYLDILFTHPAHQRKGVAGILMRWGLSRADEDGLEVYLEASLQGKPVYEHLGFQEVALVRIPVLATDRDAVGKLLEGETDIVESTMWRPAKSV